jgi:hypothetical protein
MPFLHSGVGNQAAIGGELRSVLIQPRRLSDDINGSPAVTDVWRSG